MSYSATRPDPSRRDFISRGVSAAALTGAASLVGGSDVWSAPAHRPLDRINPDMLFGTTSSLWGHARHRVGDKADLRAGTPGHRAVCQPDREVSKQPARAQKALRCCRHHHDRRVQRRQRTVDKLHRSGSDSENHRRPRSIRARFSPAVRLRSLEVQCGGSSGRRSDRRSTQTTRRYVERDRPADHCHGDTARAASSHLGADGARA